MKTALIIVLLVMFSGVAFATEKVVYFCPDCGGERIQWVRGPWFPSHTVIRKSLVDVVNNDVVYPEPLYRPAWAARCLDCGYSVSLPPKEIRQEVRYIQVKP